MGFSRTDGVLRAFMEILSFLATLFMILMVIFTIFSFKSKDQYGSTFAGHRLFIVLSDSMSETSKNTDVETHFDAGDIVVAKSLDGDEKYELEEGDIISFISTNSDSYDKVLTHMIRSVEYDSNGKVIGYTTYGTATGVDDEAMAKAENVLGEYSFSIPKLGTLFAFVRTPAGYLSCIFMPFVVLICWYGLKIMRILGKI